MKNTKSMLLGALCFGTALVVGTLPALAEDLEFTLTNQSSSNLVAFHVSHTGTSAWEDNLMDGGFLPPGNEIQVLIGDGLSTCQYDIRADFEDGSNFEDYDLNLCDMGGYTFTDQ